MDGMTRRGFLGAAATVATGYMAVCLDGSGDEGNNDTGCAVYEFADDTDAVPDDVLDEAYQHILDGVRNNRDAWLEEANDRFGDEGMYDGLLFATECSAQTFYDAGAIDESYREDAQSGKQYDVGCGVTTHADGPLADIQTFVETQAGDAQTVLSIGLEAPVTALIAVPAVSMQRDDRDLAREDYDAFLDSINSVSSQVGDRAGNHVEVYVLPEQVQTFAERFGPEDNADVFMDIREYMADNMTCHMV
jgi:hypothetical protein